MQKKMDCFEILVNGEGPNILWLANDHENPAIWRFSELRQY